MKVIKLLDIIRDNQLPPDAEITIVDMATNESYEIIEVSGYNPSGGVSQLQIVVALVLE